MGRRDRRRRGRAGLGGGPARRGRAAGRPRRRRGRLRGQGRRRPADRRTGTGTGRRPSRIRSCAPPRRGARPSSGWSGPSRPTGRWPTWSARPASRSAEQQLVPVREGAAEALATMRRLAGQVTAVEDALDRVQAGPAGRPSGDRLAAAVAAAVVGAAAGRAAAVAGQRDRAAAVAGRLAGRAGRRCSPGCRRPSFTLEGLVARTAEVLAMSASGGRGRLTADRLAGPRAATSTGCGPGWPRPRRCPGGCSTAEVT